MLQIIQFIIGGGTLAGLTLLQWETIVAAVAAAEPKVVAAIQPILALLSPVFGNALTAIAAHLQTGASTTTVAAAAHGWHQQTQSEENDWMNRFGAGTQS